MFPPAMAPAPSPMAGSGNQSALFVVIATNATVTLNSDGKGSLMLTGLNPQVRAISCCCAASQPVLPASVALRRQAGTFRVLLLRRSPPFIDS